MKCQIAFIRYEEQPLDLLSVTVTSPVLRFNLPGFQPDLSWKPYIQTVRCMMFSKTSTFLNLDDLQMRSASIRARGICICL